MRSRCAARLGLLAIPMAVAMLAGCTGGNPPAPTMPPLAAGIRFEGVLEVITVPAEPLDAVGVIRIGWAPGAFAIYNQKESDLEHYTLIMGDKVYTSNALMGWLERAPAERGNTLSNRLLLFDLRALLASPGIRISSVPNATLTGAQDIQASGVGDPGGLRVPFTARLTVRDGAILWARVDSDAGREAPYRFRPTNEALGFGFEQPTAVMTRDEAIAGNGRAQPGHVLVKRLIEDYARNHAGTLPERVEPASFTIEMAARSATWPNGAFDEQPLADRDASGHLDWRRCSLNDGVYSGYGWDGALLVQPFGKGCPAATAV